VPGQNPSGVPIPTENSIFTLAGKAIIILSATFVIFGLYLLLNSFFNNKLANDALRWVDYMRLNKN
jgi:hypothetical protein